MLNGEQRISKNMFPKFECFIFHERGTDTNFSSRISITFKGSPQVFIPNINGHVPNGAAILNRKPFVKLVNPGPGGFLPGTLDVKRTFGLTYVPIN